MKNIRLTEAQLHRAIIKTAKRLLREAEEESFEDRYNKARDNYDRPCWGFELKDKNDEWEYGEVSFDPKTNKMSCMGVEIDVDPDLSVDDNLQGLYEALIEAGYHDSEM